MKFEEVLPLMREGKKAKIKSLDKYRHWVVSEASLMNREPFWITLSSINDEDGTTRHDRSSWGIPRWAIMSDKWEIVDDPN